MDDQSNTMPAKDEAGLLQTGANVPWTITEAQQTIDQWIRTVGVRYFSPLTNLAQLMEEVGELARIISRTHGEQSFKPSDRGTSLSDELADVLFVTICLANQCGVDLDAALKANLDKKNRRDQTRHQQNEKLHTPQTTTTPNSKTEH